MRFNFPTWTNRFVPVLIVTILGGAAYVGAVVFAATDPKTLNIGHKPTQPVPFSHKTHAGRLKMDCRYCHNTVDKAAFAAIPPTATCSNCHTGADANGSVSVSAVHSDSPNLALVRQSQATGEPIDWIKVHDLPDYVYFDHSAHVNSGVSCVSCPRACRPNGCRRAGQDAVDDLLSRLPPESGPAPPAARAHHGSGLGSR